MVAPPKYKSAPPPRQLHVDGQTLTIPGGQYYAIEVWQLACANIIAIVHDAYGNPSLMNVREDISDAVHEQWPSARIIECWDVNEYGTLGRDGSYNWATSHVDAVNLDELALLGLELRSAA